MKPPSITFIIIIGFFLVAFAFMYFLLRPETPPDHTLYFNTTISPGNGEVLLRNSPQGGDIVTSYTSVLPGFAYEPGLYQTDKLPGGFFYITYLPDAFGSYHGVSGYKNYIGPANISDLSTPKYTEENSSGKFSVFDVSLDYAEQYLMMILAFSAADDEKADIMYTTENIYRDSQASYMTSADSMKKEHPNLSASFVYDLEVMDFAHPLFDYAYIVSYKQISRDYTHFEFYGYKVIETPFEYYNFDDSATELTNDNLADYVVTADLLEFSINCYPQVDYVPAEAQITKDEIMRAAESIIFTNVLT